MDSRMSEIERWRREQVDPAIALIPTLQADMQQIKNDMAMTAKRDQVEGLRIDLRTNTAWTKLGALTAILLLVVLALGLAWHGL